MLSREITIRFSAIEFLADMFDHANGKNHNPNIGYVPDPSDILHAGGGIIDGEKDELSEVMGEGMTAEEIEQQQVAQDYADFQAECSQVTCSGRRP